MPIQAWIPACAGIAYMDVGNMYRTYGSSATQEQLPRGVSTRAGMHAGRTTQGAVVEGAEA